MTSFHDLNIIQGIMELDTKILDDIPIQIFRESDCVEQINSNKILVFFNWPFLAQSLEDCDQVIICAPSKEENVSVSDNINCPELTLESSPSCTSCGKVFPSVNKLRKHISNAHQDVSCKICKKSFRSKGSLKNHEEIHKSLSSKLKCDICGKVINQSVNFDRHRLVVVIIIKSLLGLHFFISSLH